MPDTPAEFTTVDACALDGLSEQVQAAFPDSVFVLLIGTPIGLRHTDLHMVTNLDMDGALALVETWLEAEVDDTGQSAPGHH